MKTSRVLAPPRLPAAINTPFRINHRHPRAAEKIAAALRQFMKETEAGECTASRLVLCVGSDRSTGDALGPLVGTTLKGLHLPRVTVWGTLAEPVHALNLPRYLTRLQEDRENSLILAVDASLGNPGSIGMIEVGKGPLYPGAGVNKKLPPVGHCYLSGIVNLSGFMEQMVLQSTRLFLVMELAAVITAGLAWALTGSPEGSREAKRDCPRHVYPGCYWLNK